LRFPDFSGVQGVDQKLFEAAAEQFVVIRNQCSERHRASLQIASAEARDIPVPRDPTLRKMRRKYSPLNWKSCFKTSFIESPAAPPIPSERAARPRGRAPGGWCRCERVRFGTAPARGPRDCARWEPAAPSD